MKSRGKFMANYIGALSYLEYSTVNHANAKDQVQFHDGHHIDDNGACRLTVEHRKAKKRLRKKIGIQNNHFEFVKSICKVLALKINFSCL